MKDILHSQFEIKQISEPKDGFATFEGYASVFDYTDSQMDTVAKGAFQDSIGSYRKVKMLWQHDERTPIGMYPSLKEDTKGLFAQGQICLATQKGQECYALMRQGAIDALSIGFVTKDYEMKANGVREIKKADLYEISPVTFPANDKALLTDVKSLITRATTLADLTIKEFERKLRDVFNCTQAEAKIIASDGFKALHRDGDKIALNDSWNKILGSFAN